MELRVQSRRTMGLRENGTEPTSVELSGTPSGAGYWNGCLPCVPH